MTRQKHRVSSSIPECARLAEDVTYFRSGWLGDTNIPTMTTKPNCSRSGMSFLASKFLSSDVEAICELSEVWQKGQGRAVVCGIWKTHQHALYMEYQRQCGPRTIGESPLVPCFLYSSFGVITRQSSTSQATRRQDNTLEHTGSY